MRAAQYEVLQTDARTGDVVRTLPVTGIGYQDTLNASGSASVGIPLDAAEADPDTLVSGASGLVVLRNDVPVWGGILINPVADLAQNTLTLNAAGYHSYYKGVFLIDGYERKADQAHLIRDWIDLRNERNGIATDTSRITTTGRARTRRWTRYEVKNVGEAIEELAEDADGFNFRYEPFWSIPGERVGHRFIKSTRGGQPLGISLEHRINCDVSQVAYDASAMCTNAYAIGADNGNGTKLLASAANVLVAQRMPNKHVVATYSDVKSSAVLRDKADAMASVGSEPIAIPSLTLYPGVFSPLEFTPGDSGPVRVDHGYVRLYDEFVVTDRKTAVDVNGSETITLSLANKGVFTNASTG